MCIIIIGPLEKLINNRLMVILGKLSYSVYLVNTPVIMMIQSKKKSVVAATVDTIVNICILYLLKYVFLLLIHIIS